MIDKINIKVINKKFMKNPFFIDLIFLMLSQSINPNKNDVQALQSSDYYYRFYFGEQLVFV